MRLALYHPWTYLKGGVERTLVELLERSEHDWTLYTHHFDPDATFPELAEHRVVELDRRVSVERSIGPLARAAGTITRSQLPADGSKALLVSSEGLGDLVLARTRLPAVCYCHTPLKILHDPATRERLADSDRMKSLALDVIGPAFEVVDRTMWRRYRHAFVNSTETARRVQQAGLVPSGAVEVLHPGVDRSRFAGEPRRRRPFFLVAGRIMWQKNVELAVDALATALDAGIDAELVVAGAVDRKSEPYLARLRERATGLPVRFVADPSDAELTELYRTCLALLFTPLNEDWGIVPLEAMAAGAPVLAVDRGGPRESVLHGVTGWLLPPQPSAFALRMLEVAAGGPRIEQMRPVAVARAGDFDWDAFVARIDEVMAHVAAGRPVPAPAAESLAGRAPRRRAVPTPVPSARS
jgi:glycosyltransferase involved in cell wall biosynthesis